MNDYATRLLWLVGPLHTGGTTVGALKILKKALIDLQGWKRNIESLLEFWHLILPSLFFIDVLDLIYKFCIDFYEK